MKQLSILQRYMVVPPSSCRAKRSHHKIVARYCNSSNFTTTTANAASLVPMQDPRDRIHVKNNDSAFLSCYHNDHLLLGSTRNFATKRQQRAAAAKKNDDENKKKDMTNSTKSEPTQFFGTAKTGLILPGASSIETRSPTTLEDQFSPLLDNQLDIIQPPTADFPNNLTPPSSSSILQEGNPSHPLRNLVQDTNTNNNTVNLLDLASTYDPTLHLPQKPNFNDPKENYEPSTPLGEELMRFIGVSGQGGMSVAEYMKKCLRDERFGYYTNPPKDSDIADDDDNLIDDDDDDDDDWDIDHDETHDTTKSKKEGRGHRIIGTAGDFTTAPEISQIFGECLTIWLLTQYEALGRPEQIQLVEIGPGRGTLICDVLRSAGGIKGLGEDFINALKKDDGDGDGNGRVLGVHLVEVSEHLRASQQEALKTLETTTTTTTATEEESPKAFRFDCLKWKTKEEQQKEVEALVQRVRKHVDSGEEADPELVTKLLAEMEQEEMEAKKSQGDGDGDDVQNKDATTTEGSISVQWHDDFNMIPSLQNEKGKVPTFVIGQEILDALPIHVFQKTKDGWRERYVDVAIQESQEENHNSGSTSSKPSSESEQKETKKPRFRYVLAEGVTPALRTLLHIDDDGKPMTTSANSESNENAELLNSAPIGSIMEVCPEAMLLAQDITTKIEECGGAAILIDYGNEGSGDTLRAFRKHKQVDILSTPGMVDITADVDFAAVRNAVNVGMKDVRKNNGERSKTDVGGDDDGSIVVTTEESDENLPLAFGPVPQGQFLSSMGAVERTVNLIEDDATTDEQAEELCTALERLVSEEEMGLRYKVMAITRKKDGIFPPPGF